jgi:hypothetical protein
MLDDEIEARLVLTNAFLAQSKTVEAKTEMAELRPIEDKTENRSLSLRFSLEQRRILLAGHDLRSSSTLVETVLKASSSLGYEEIMLEAQTILADVQSESGDKVGASRQQSLLEARERNAGLLLLAKKINAVHMKVANAGNPSNATR